MSDTDVLVIGAGVVGLATAVRLIERAPGCTVRVLDKEAALGAHQTGRNSGVLHSGIYYKPGSLKARTCQLGKRALERFCEQRGVAFERCGKVVVAVDASELPRLDRIEERARANGVICERIGPERLRELEPHATGVAALHVPGSGIIDYVAVCRAMADIVASSGEVVLGARAGRLEVAAGRTTVEAGGRRFSARVLVNCAGLHSDRVARRTGMRVRHRIVPFRGEYFELVPEAAGLVSNLIYPVPDPAFPFLGVHFTRMIGGGVECGPNAVLAPGREAYRKLDLQPLDLLETLTFPGFWRLAARHFGAGAAEVWRSLSKAAFTRALQRLVPEIRAAHLRPAPAGIRAQALAPDGSLVDDFLLEERPGVINVCNAPSPAATASLAIGDVIGDRVLAQLGRAAHADPAEHALRG